MGAVYAPIPALVAYLLHPFWKWMDKATAIEASGHFGIAVLCFVATYVAMLGLFAAYQKVFKHEPVLRKL